MAPLSLSLVADADSADRELLDAFRGRGEREALARLFSRHADAAYRLALRLGRNPADAEDAVQEGFMKMIASAHSYRGHGPVRAWILSFVAHSLRHQLRSEERRRRREAWAASQPAGEEDPDACDQARHAAVLQCLEELPELYRIPVALRYLDGLEFSDIGAAVGSRERTVRTRVSRGLEMLRAALARRAAPLSVAGILACFEPAHAAAPSELKQELRDVADSAVAPLPFPFGKRFINALGTNTAVVGSLLILAACASYLAMTSQTQQNYAVESRLDARKGNPEHVVGVPPDEYSAHLGQPGQVPSHGAVASISLTAVAVVLPDKLSDSASAQDFGGKICEIQLVEVNDMLLYACVTPKGITGTIGMGSGAGGSVGEAHRDFHIDSEANYKSDHGAINVRVAGKGEEKHGAKWVATINGKPLDLHNGNVLLIKWTAEGRLKEEQTAYELPICLNHKFPSCRIPSEAADQRCELIKALAAAVEADERTIAFFRKE